MRRMYMDLGHPDYANRSKVKVMAGNDPNDLVKILKISS